MSSPSLVQTSNPLLMKLEQFRHFSADDRLKIEGLSSERQKTWGPRRDILRDGARPEGVLLVLSGMAARYKDLPSGERQIMAFLIPGDLCDLEVFVLDRMDHGIVAMTETTCAIIPVATIKALLTDMTGLTEALWWSTMTDSAVLRERIIDHGRRDARERLAHLLYEMLIRYRIIGMADDNSYPLPLTQADLAEATGLTPVHTNRMMQQLRAEGLIEHRGRLLTVKDPAGLKAVARFSSRYLHLRRTEERDGPVAERAGDLL